MAPQPTSMRRTRERDLVRATRALFDERGLQDAPIEEIARSVGIARGLIYRQFSSKEELYVLTVTDYLTELDGLLSEATSPDLEPVAQLEAWARAYVGFCLRYPAFLDCALSLMHRPAGELREALSDSVWDAPGAGSRAAWSTYRRSCAPAPGTARSPSGPDYMANVLWTQVLGATHLAHPRRRAAGRAGHPDSSRSRPGASRGTRRQRAGDRRRPAVKLGPVERNCVRSPPRATWSPCGRADRCPG
jgi:AcrR family transcriptional regulator